MDPSELQHITGQVAARWQDPDYGPRILATEATLDLSNRFTFEAISFAVNQQMHQLSRRALHEWIGDCYVANPRRVVVVNPGNIPLAGLQDYLGVILLGHRYFGKLSTRSPHLLKAFADDMRGHGASFTADLSVEMPVLLPDDGLILSGFDETVSLLAAEARQAGIDETRILERGRRYSVAVIESCEKEDVLERLAEDILLHEGLGCRNVAIVWAPEGTTPDGLLEAMARFRALFPAHEATIGSLKMQIAYYQAAGLPHAYADDGSFLVSRGDPEVQQPAHVRWTEYSGLEQVRHWIMEHGHQLQLVVAPRHVCRALEVEGTTVVEPGDAQRPRLGWKQDQRDVVRFLHSL